MSRVRLVRQLLGCASVALLAAGIMPASANPNTAGQYRDDVGSIVIRGVDGLTYRVLFELRASSGQPTQSAVLTVSYQGCKPSGKCGYTYSYQLPIASSAMSTPNANAISVTGTFAGARVSVAWSATANPTSPSIAGTIDAGNGVTVTDPSSGGPAHLSATVFGLTCSGAGRVTNYLGVFTAPTAGGPAAPTSVPKQFKASKRHRPSCQS